MNIIINWSVINVISHKNSANHVLRGNKEQEKNNFNISLIIREIMAINEVAKAGSASWTLLL